MAFEHIEDSIQLVKKSMEATHAAIADKLVHLTTLVDLASSTTQDEEERADQVAALQAEVDHGQYQLREKSIILRQLLAQRANYLDDEQASSYFAEPPREKKNFSSPAHNHHTPAHNHLYSDKKPSFNIWDGKMAPAVYLDKLEAEARASNYNPLLWIAGLIASISDPVDQRWAMKALSGLSWEEARSVFEGHFQQYSRRHDTLSEILNFRCRAGESTRHLADRFEQLVTRGFGTFRPPDSTLALDALLGQIFTRAIPQGKLKDQLLTIQSGEDSWRDCIASALALDSRVRAASSEEDSRPRCEGCGNRGHTREQCRKTNPHLRTSHNPTAGPSNNSFSQRPSHPPSNNSTALAKPHSAHKNVRSLTVDKTMTEPSLGETQHGVRVGALWFHGIDPSQVAFPAAIWLNGNKVFGSFDSGATATVISQRLAHALGLVISPCDQVARNFDGSPITVYGWARNVELQHHNHSAVADLLVAEANGVDLTIGSDLGSQLGIRVSGLSAVHESTMEILPPSESNLKNEPSVDIEIPEEVLLSINRNMQLDKASPCNVPEAVVRVDTGTAPPDHLKQYPIPIGLRSFVSEQVAAWESSGVIVRSPPGALYNLPLLAVPKQIVNGEVVKVRVCLDPRALNKHIIAVPYPMPTPDEIFTKFSGATIFSTLDLESGYHQFPVFPYDQHKLAFTWDHIPYQFVRCPFGLNHVTMQFQRVMDIVLSGLSFAQVYVDDIIISSRTQAEHCLNVRAVLDRLTTSSLRVNISKCVLFRSSLSVLGFIVDVDGIRADPAKVEPVASWPLPKTPRALQSFLGFINYFRAHIPNLATLARPLDALRHNVVWTDAAMRSFEACKDAVMQMTMRYHPDFDKLFFVDCDASLVGLGAVLYQSSSDDGSTLDRPIAFYSRALTRAELQYHPGKLELLAIVTAFRKFRDYLLNRPFRLFTDHNSLVGMLNKEHANHMVSNWVEEICSYSFTVTHKPGTLNVLADALSRRHEPHADISVTIRSVLTNTDTSKTKWLGEAHSQGHFGHRQMMFILSEAGRTWPGMRRDVKQFISSCSTCSKFREGPPIPDSRSTIKASAPWDHIQIDLITDLPEIDGHKHILTLVDVMSGFTILQPLRSKRAEAVMGSLFRIFSIFGFPKIIQSDNGKEFSNNLLRNWITKAASSQRHSTPYYPQCNGKVERVNGLVKRLLSRLIDEHNTDWPQLLPLTQWLLNIRPTTSGSFSPYESFFLRRPPTVGDWRGTDPGENSEEWLDHIGKAKQVWSLISEADAATRLEKSNSSPVAEQLDPGQKVWIRRSVKGKLDSPLEGPFTIRERKRNNTYLLQHVKRRYKRVHLVPLDEPSQLLVGEDVVHPQ